MALETFATKASEELLLMMMRTTLPQYALSNVYFFSLENLSIARLVVNLHKHGVFATSRFSHYLPKYQRSVLKLLALATDNPY